MVAIDWNFKEEDDILERTKNVIEKINSCLRMKKDTCISDQIDPISNVGLTIATNRRSLRISKKKIHNPPLMQKTHSKKKTKMSVSIELHQII